MASKRRFLESKNVSRVSFVSEAFQITSVNKVRVFMYVITRKVTPTAAFSHRNCVVSYREQRRSSANAFLTTFQTTVQRNSVYEV